MIINLFCDASIDLNTKTACGGCVIVLQDEIGISEIGRRLIIQQNATNNSSEILAIWIGVVEALKLRNQYPGAVFRLFSDSKISLYGLRDWMKNWIRNITPEGVLLSSSGEPVKNQQRFIEVFNLIVENNLKIELYHQRGHVNEGKMSLNKARASFIKANKVTPEAVGMSIELISQFNSVVDNATRDAVYAYLSNGTLLNAVELEGISPIEYSIRSSMCHQYIRCIDKTSVVSRHDFKGGYNQ